QLVPTFLCPADNPPAQVTYQPRTTTFYERDDVYRTNYLFSTGYYTDYDRDWNQTGAQYRGAFGNNGAANLNSMPDGTSNTIAIGESRQEKNSSSYGPYFSGTHTAVHGRILSTKPGGTTLATAITYCSINGQNQVLGYSYGLQGFSQPSSPPPAPPPLPPPGHFGRLPGAGATCAF